MANTLLFILSFWFHLTANNFIHPVHISLTTIEYAKGREEMAVTYKVNTEDFEYAVIRNNKFVSDIGKIKESTEFNRYIENYINATFSLTIDGTKSKLKFIEKKNIETDTWLYFKITGIKKIKKMEIMNALLFDTYMDQTNLLIISFNGKEQGFKTSYDNRTITLNPKTFNK
jgi:hypothetical protein